MHVNKCRDWATLGSILFQLLLATCVFLAAGLALGAENKQNEQSTRLANLTLRANSSTSARPRLAQLATSKRQINNVYSRRVAGKVAPGPPPPTPPAPSNNNQSRRSISKYKLPSWFHFNTFKQLYGKRYPGGYVDELHKRIYLRTSLKVFEQRALYRSGRLDSLASVNELSDLTGEQLDQFRALRNGASSPPTGGAKQPIKNTQAPSRQLPECCTYDQVYARIIGLLSAATDSNDSALSRALVDELEQKPLVELIHDEPILNLGPAPVDVLTLGGNEHRPPLVKSTRRAQGQNKAFAGDIDDKREHRMIERRHRDDGHDEMGRQQEAEGEKEEGKEGEEGKARELQRKRAQLNNSTAMSRRRQQAAGASIEQRMVVVAEPAAKSNLARDHQTASASAGAVRLRSARPSSASSNRLTTSTGAVKPAAGNTSPLTGRKAGAHSEPADYEDERSAAELGVAKEIEEAVRAQVAEQLSSSSPLGRELSKQMSAYFGQPVEIRAVPATGSDQTVHKSGAQKPRPKQQQQQQSAPSTRAV